MNGYKVGVDYILSKNIVANISYYDVKNKKLNNVIDVKTKLLRSRLTFTFHNLTQQPDS